MPEKINIKGPIVDNDTAWIYGWFGWDCASPNTIARGLAEADGEDVVLEINSPGGLVTSGYEMYTNIMEYNGKVTAHVISACSAATLPVCAADEALISDTGVFMIHNAKSGASGDYRDLQMEADALREIDEGIINAYVRKTGLSREDIQNLMDNNTYMSPQTAIQHGFINGYMFGDPNKKTSSEGDIVNFVSRIVAADAPIIPADKARELTEAIRNMEAAKVAPVQPKEPEQDMQNIGIDAVSENKNDVKGEIKMTLTEFLAENPEAQEELNTMTGKAKIDGQKEERARMQSLDAIARAVTKEALNAAKYGENPIDGKELVYQATVDGERLAAAYMEKAKKDFEDSGAKDVGIGNPDAGQEATDEADEMASYVNKTNGGK